MIVVNFATGHYLRGQQRLINSLPQGQKYLAFKDYAEIGSPTHSESPYEFKVHAIESAFHIDDVVLWMDASMWRVGDLNVIKNIIETDGYFMETAGHWVGSWCNQFTRDYMKMTPEELAVPGGLFMFSAGLLGLSKQSPIAMEFFKQWKESALAGCFRGSWNDHRHDMTLGSIIAQRLGMTYQPGGKHLSYIGPGYSAPLPTSIIHLQGI